MPSSFGKTAQFEFAGWLLPAIGAIFLVQIGFKARSGCAGKNHPAATGQGVPQHWMVLISVTTSGSD
jgi:hypothetical protein